MATDRLFSVQRENRMNILKALLMTKKRTRKAQAHVLDRVERHQCLVHDCERSHDEPGAARGLCSPHYQAIQNQLRYMDPEAALTKEANLIQWGLLLDRHEIGKLRRHDPFASAG